VNPLILSIDTTHEFGSIALLACSEVVEEVPLHSTDGFGHVLFGHLDRLLQKHGRRVNDVACFAAASGPGSFTGVRIGLACVKGLAEAAERKVVTVSNLEAMARFGSAVQRAVVMDARRGEVYGAVYGAAGQTLCEPRVTSFPAWLDSLPAGDIEFIATDFAPFRSALEGTRFEDAKLTVAPRALAAAIGQIAFERFRAGLAHDPAVIDADYVRRSDAELFWKED
jgi:tRNA threonylcarbamoyladenosine biosynthesis protein TsaB